MSLSPIAPTRLPLAQKVLKNNENEKVKSKISAVSANAYETPARGQELPELPELNGRSNNESSHHDLGKDANDRNELEDSFFQSSLSSGIMNSKPISVCGSDVSAQT
eukprot:12157665-Ditylum_brightwellii.AAC.1